MSDFGMALLRELEKMRRKTERIERVRLRNNMRFVPNKCAYCHGMTATDGRGNCVACGAPRNNTEEYGA